MRTVGTAPLPVRRCSVLRVWMSAQGTAACMGCCTKLLYGLAGLLYGLAGESKNIVKVRLKLIFCL